MDITHEELGYQKVILRTPSPNQNGTKLFPVANDVKASRDVLERSGEDLINPVLVRATGTPLGAFFRGLPVPTLGQNSCPLCSERKTGHIFVYCLWWLHTTFSQRSFFGVSFVSVSLGTGISTVPVSQTFSRPDVQM